MQLKSIILVIVVYIFFSTMKLNVIMLSWT